MVAIALGLLANCSLHAAVISGGWQLCILWSRFYTRKRTCATARTAAVRSDCIGVLCVCDVDRMAAGGHIVFIECARKQADFHFAALRAIFLPIFQTWILAVFFWVAVTVMFCARRSWFYLLPVVMFAVFCGVIPGNFWHYGLAVPLVVALLWITWPEARAESRSDLAGRVAVICMAGAQILWSGYAIYFGHYNAYSPDAATARYLRPYVEDGSTIAVTYLDETASHVANALGFFLTLNVISTSIRRIRFIGGAQRRRPLAWQSRY